MQHPYDILNDPVLKDLASLDYSTEGNFLFKHNMPSVATESTRAQIATWEYVRSLIPQDQISLMEIGTNKGMFLLFALRKLGIRNIVTFDVLPQAGRSVEILRREFPNVDMEFVSGDTKVTLFEYISSNRSYAPDIVWLDGGHDFETSLNDLMWCIFLQPAFILIDDYYQSAGVAEAIKEALADQSRYAIIDNPFGVDDYKGICILRKVGRA